MTLDVPDTYCHRQEMCCPFYFSQFQSGYSSGLVSGLMDSNVMVVVVFKFSVNTMRTHEFPRNSP